MNPRGCLAEARSHGPEGIGSAGPGIVRPAHSWAAKPTPLALANANTPRVWHMFGWSLACAVALASLCAAAAGGLFVLLVSVAQRWLS